MTEPRLRCAIYTRKSTEDGLDKAFNSLDAQFEACAAYISSQKHEGWERIDTRYDDGGYSGASLKRPGLEALLADVRAGDVNVIVVYKVDRLSRSLSDFAKLVEILDKHKVSFVSITQQFNTTSSMGRLTLNMLLSFAQFEREVIGERVRDKVAASKQKGMWMGGVPPLGYDVVARKLVVNAIEADFVRSIFAQYIVCNSLNKLAQDLNALGHRNKCWLTVAGVARGGQLFTNQSLSKILNNPVYPGQTRHCDRVYDGQHDAIIPLSTWDTAQQMLKHNLVREEGKSYTSTALLLSGKCVDELGRVFTSTYTVKRKTQRYYYYLQKDSQRRIRADLLEREILQILRDYYGSEHNDIKPHGSGRKWLDILRTWDSLPQEYRRAEMQKLISRITIATDMLHINIDFSLHRAGPSGLGMGDMLMPVLALCKQESNRDKRGGCNESDTKMRSLKITISGETICISRAVNFLRAGKTIRTTSLVAINRTGVRKPNPILIKALARAHVWGQLVDKQKSTITAIAKQTKLGRPYVTRILNLRFLAPDIVEAIINGAAPAGLNLKSLMAKVQLDWETQRKHTGIWLRNCEVN